MFVRISVGIQMFFTSVETIRYVFAFSGGATFSPPPPPPHPTHTHTTPPCL